MIFQIVWLIQDSLYLSVIILICHKFHMQCLILKYCKSLFYCYFIFLALTSSAVFLQNWSLTEENQGYVIECSLRVIMISSTVLLCSRAVVLESGLGLETFFYRLGLVLDSLVFGLGLVSDLVIGLAKCSSWSRPSPAIYAFFSRLFRKWVM